MNDPLIHDFYLGCMRAHILYHALSEPVYDAAPMKELGRHGTRSHPVPSIPGCMGLEKKGI